MSTRNGSGRVLALSTFAFTLMFAVWLMFGVLGIPIQKEFGISEIIAAAHVHTIKKYGPDRVFGFSPSTFMPCNWD